MTEDMTPEEIEQMFNYYEYKRAYKISVEGFKKRIEETRKSIGSLLDELKANANRLMESARCMEGGGVRCGKVWDLYPNNPDEKGLQKLEDHIKHLKNSNYPFEQILDVLKDD